MVDTNLQLRYIVEDAENGKIVLKLIEEGLPTIKEEHVLAAISSELERIKGEVDKGMHLFLLTIQISATDTFTPSPLKKHNEQK